MKIMKIMINGQIITQSSIFAKVLTTQNLWVLSVVPNIYQKLDSVMCIFSSMTNEKFFLKRG